MCCLDSPSNMTFPIKLVFSLLLSLLLLEAIAQTQDSAITPTEKIVLFNGKNLAGWVGNEGIWKVHHGVIVGGDKTTIQPKNEFLCTVSAYKNYELELEFKIKGYEGFINAGVQFHSERLTNSNEMKGFQADIGSDCMGSLYDESRRDTYLVKADQQRVKLKKGWNRYKIICRENTITLFINDKQTIAYSELDSTIPLAGKIGLQIHGGGVLEVFYKNIVIKPLPLLRQEAIDPLGKS
jgi:Domain of Unknown Function (DUF1080)